MQIFALDKKNILIAAPYALRQQDYYCIECHALVRLRGGVHRQLHFYHLEPPQTCRLSQKSAIHLQIQLFLQKLLSLEAIHLEARFPEIQRIADVFWPTKNIVFEIQCSPLSVDIVRARNRDYASLGLQTVWILHEKQFKGSRLSAVEIFLQNSPHYYTNMDARGVGMIYDRYIFPLSFFRVKRSISVPVELHFPQKIKQVSGHSTSLLKKRMESWKIHFKGDLIDRAKESSFMEKLRAVEAYFQGASSTKRFFWERWMYHLVLILNDWVKKHC